MKADIQAINVFKLYTYLHNNLSEFFNFQKIQTFQSENGLIRPTPRCLIKGYNHLLSFRKIPTLPTVLHGKKYTLLVVFHVIDKEICPPSTHLFGYYLFIGSCCYRWNFHFIWWFWILGIHFLVHCCYFWIAFGTGGFPNFTSIGGQNSIAQ